MLVVLGALFGGLSVTFGLLAGFAGHQEAVAANETAAKANERAAEATERAAEATERAEKSETARVAMLDRLKPRDLTKAQVDAIADELRGHFNEIYLAGLADPDAMQFTFAIAEAIKRSGATPRLFLDNSRSPARFWKEFDVPVALNGVTVYAAKDDMQLIMQALLKGNVANIGGVPAPGEQFSQVPIPTIFVGLKPEPFEEFPAYLAPPSLENWQKEHPPPWSPK